MEPEGSPPGSHRWVPRHEIAHPRISILLVLRRVQVRMIDIQVWDVAGTMTFYTVLSVLPAAVAMVSLLSLAGLEDQTVTALGGLLTEIFPSLDPAPYERTILAIADNTGGVLGFALGTLGALISASNGVAAFHRALHRVHDTREGRPFLWFRTIVLGETVVLIGVIVLTAFIVVMGGRATRQIGEFFGVPGIAFDAWNLVKWPILLVVLTFCVSLAYYLFPNVRLPRYRMFSLGSILSVSVLFLAALAVGRFASWATRFSEVLTALNGLIGILLLIWLANIVIIAGAALDAEFLRARQLARGMEAWGRILLDPQATVSIDFLEREAARDEVLGRAVAEGARTGRPVLCPEGPWVVDADSPLAVNPSRRASRPRSSPASPTSHPSPVEAPDPEKEP